MVDAELENSAETQDFIELERAGEVQLQKQVIRRDIEHEIECPRCYDTLNLIVYIIHVKNVALYCTL
jgi:hypothetical protein